MVATTPPFGSDSGMDAELRPRCRVATVEDEHDSFEQAVSSIYDRNGVTSQEGGSHSGFTETSLVLASGYARYVDMSVAERGFVGDTHAAIAEATKEAAGASTIFSPIGVLGDPVKANAEAGRDLLREMSRLLAKG